jgi:hypothetical protein
MPTALVTGATAGIFTSISTNTYLLYRDVEAGSTGSSNLKVLGYIQTKTSNTVVVLSENVLEEIESLYLELFTWPGTNNVDNLNTLNFNFQDSFYMAVKNANYTSTNHDAVLLIDVDRTSTNYTDSPQPFAYSADRIINPAYFTIERITKVYKPLIEEEEIVSIPCTIKGISTYSEKSMFPTGGVSLVNIPFWSVYEIIPYTISGTHLDKNTFYRLTINDVLPSSQILPP